MTEPQFIHFMIYFGIWIFSAIIISILTGKYLIEKTNNGELAYIVYPIYVLLSLIVVLLIYLT